MPQNRQALRQQKRSLPESYDERYVEGSTVRRLSPAPYPEEEPDEEELRRQAALRRKEQERAKIAADNRAKVFKIDLKYTVFLVAAVTVTVLMCIYYLNLQSELSAKEDSISSLESELITLIESNEATQERLDQSVDLEEIYEIATEEMGMSYPDEDQIIYYSESGDDYVKQYQDIPDSN